MTAWTMSLKRVASQLGAPGWLGLLMAACAAMAWGLVVPDQRAELDAELDQIAHLRQQLLTTTSAGGSRQAQATTPPLAEQAQAAWQHVWQALPSQAQGTDLQVEVLNAARAHGLSLQSVQYKGAALKALPLVWRQQISLPVEAPYPALRAWLAQLQRQPALSIDALDISRTDAMSEQVKARVAVSLWWRLADQGAKP